MSPDFIAEFPLQKVNQDVAIDVRRVEQFVCRHTDFFVSHSISSNPQMEKIRSLNTADASREGCIDSCKKVTQKM